MAEETFTERLARLETLADLEPGEHVRVIQSGRTGVLVKRRQPTRDGWDVRWDEPMFGVEVGRASTVSLERFDPEEVVVGCAGCGGYRLAGETHCSNCRSVA